MASKQQFTKEFRESAVRLVVDQGRTVSDVAASLGIKVDVLKWWVRAFKRSGEKAQAVEETSLRRRVRELEAENRRLLMEREILKNHPRAASHLLDQKLGARYTKRGPEGAAVGFLETTVIPLKNMVQGLQRT